MWRVLSVGIAPSTALCCHTRQRTATSLSPTFFPFSRFPHPDK